MNTILLILGIFALIAFVLTFVIVASTYLQRNFERNNPFAARSWYHCAWCSHWFSNEGRRRHKEKPAGIETHSSGLCKICEPRVKQELLRVTGAVEI